MDDALGVRRLKHLAQLAEQPADAHRRQPLVALSSSVERDAADVLHDDARPLRIVERGIVESDGVGMLEAGHQQRFALKAFAELRVGGDVVVHDLDDDLPTEIELAGQVDATHAALAQKADGLIPAQEDTADHSASYARVDLRALRQM